MKNIEIISLIYKSIDYLNLIYKQLSLIQNTNNYNIYTRIVANDPTQDIIEHLKKININYTIYNDKNINEYYLNRVYRCWNYAGMNSKYDNICFVNSDMIFEETWLENLLKHHNGKNIPCSRLIESGKMPSGKYGISYNCGRNPKNINNNMFIGYCKDVKENKIEQGGLYMPCIFKKQLFIESGGYPEGNIYDENGHFVKSGDAHYFELLEQKYNMKHVTVFDSLVYHIQEGEMDE